MKIPSPRTLIRRLAAADGYLELGMPRQAIEELDLVDNFGPLSAPADFLRGKALKAQDRCADAIAPLERAAKSIPAPFSGPIWRMLGECLRHEGLEDQAAKADTAADASLAAGPKNGGSPVISIQIISKKSKPKSKGGRF